jgi:hypothetical protein
MNNFLQYANAAQKALRIGVTSAHKEFFENLPQKNNTKLEFVVGEEQTGGSRKSLFKNPGKCCGPYSEYVVSYKKSKKKIKRKHRKNTKNRKINRHKKNTKKQNIKGK